MPGLVLQLHAVIVALSREEPRVLTLEGLTGGAPGRPALPFGPLDPQGDRTLELALRRWIRTQTGNEVGYVEQLYTFGDRFRDPREAAGGPRVVSVAYLALVREEQLAGSGASWSRIYSFYPWEDWREGRPPVIDQLIRPRLEHWIAASPSAEEREHRRDRAGVAFGLDEAPWDPDRVLERYELLYELRLVPEAWRDRGKPPPGDTLGREMALDHRRILATGVSRIRGKIRYRPVIFELLPETFTLLTLQRAVEALAGVRLHKQNFRRLVERGGLVEGTGELEPRTGGRPAERFRFRREVVRERPAPGVGLPRRRG